MAGWLSARPVPSRFWDQMVCVDRFPRGLGLQDIAGGAGYRFSTPKPWARAVSRTRPKPPVRGQLPRRWRGPPATRLFSGYFPFPFPVFPLN